ncbi:uncharacterized protein K441DRAFT_582971, partial [Cenococcum geophilum 1.58]|uniref:uncharacterized protein n=1 Tax=Cenococcum geophilum 1.58 TaxID=794803 RepID=UPI00358EC9CA
GSSDVSVLITILILFYIIANIIIYTLGILGRAKLAKRYSSLFVINIVPLYLSSRTSLISNKVLYLNLS